MNTVSRGYALFPHLTVGENVAFGLRFTSTSKAERKERVARALELVRLFGLVNRKPHRATAASSVAGWPLRLPEPAGTALEPAAQRPRR